MRVFHCQVYSSWLRKGCLNRESALILFYISKIPNNHCESRIHLSPLTLNLLFVDLEKRSGFFSDYIPPPPSSSFDDFCKNIQTNNKYTYVSCRYWLRVLWAILLFSFLSFNKLLAGDKHTQLRHLFAMNSFTFHSCMRPKSVLFTGRIWVSVPIQYPKNRD